MKVLSIIFLIFTLLLAGCQGEFVEEKPVINEEASVSNSEVREITISAKRFEFTPGVIEVGAGEKVKLVVENSDTLHGIVIPELGVKGESEVEFTAEVGEYDFYCANYCGSEHMTMSGKLIVK